MWMLINCIVSAGYVLGMRKRIKVTNFKVGRQVLSALVTGWTDNLARGRAAVRLPLRTLATCR